MNVLIVTNMYPSEQNPYYGVFVYEQVEAMKRITSDCTFEICYINGKNGLFEYVKSMFYVCRKLRKKQYDLIHIHYGLSGLFMLNPFRKRIPVVVTFHGSDIQKASGTSWLVIFISKMVAKLSSGVIVLNEEMDKIVKMYNKNTMLLPCSVNTNFFMPKNNECENEKDFFKIIFPSSSKRYVKNYPLFQDTIAILKKKYSLRVQEYKIEALSRAEVRDLYQNSDVLLMTSRSEGSPQVIKEAMACNLPCVSTPVGDVAFLLKNVKKCYVANQHSAEELAELVYKVFSEKGNGCVGRQKLFDLELDETKTCTKLLSFYRML